MTLLDHYPHARTGADIAPSEPRRYIPLDERLSRPRVRVLRALLHFDWVLVLDLAIALDIPLGGNRQTPERMSFDTALARCVRRGEVERQGRKNESHYRITATGRRLLAAELTPPIVPDEDVP